MRCPHPLSPLYNDFFFLEIAPHPETDTDSLRRARASRCLAKRTNGGVMAQQLHRRDICRHFVCCASHRPRFPEVHVIFCFVIPPSCVASTPIFSVVKRGNNRNTTTTPDARSSCTLLHPPVLSYHHLAVQPPPKTPNSLRILPTHRPKAPYLRSPPKPRNSPHPPKNSRNIRQRRSRKGG